MSQSCMVTPVASPPRSIPIISVLCISRSWKRISLTNPLQIMPPLVPPVYGSSMRLVRTILLTVMCEDESSSCTQEKSEPVPCISGSGVP